MRPLLKVFHITSLVGTSFSGISVLNAGSRRAISLSKTLYHSDRLYTKQHEWIIVKDTVGTVGITEFAQSSLGDVVYIEIPQVGTTITRDNYVGAVESVKAASDINAPVSGKVVEVNEKLEKEPYLVNKYAYDKGWIFKVELSDKEELNMLMDKNAYDAFCKENESDF